MYPIETVLKHLWYFKTKNLTPFVQESFDVNKSVYEKINFCYNYSIVNNVIKNNNQIKTIFIE
ncbi:hypothetical protein CI610_03767 [invertebrate metagenome]|uniref:Uncharacterized protein n=1 Tax=invertebrate metagenome TaxID=1711999 RepID=A0A2H9T273_9ZZZZ